MKVIILAAGEGKRLRPYTNDRPKCLVPLAGKPLLVRQVNVLRACGLNDITVMTGYKADQIQRLGFNTIDNPAYASTNMVTSLMCGRELLNGLDDVLIAYGDICYEPRIIQAICACPAGFCTTVDVNWLSLWQARNEDPLLDAETLRMDEQGYIRELGKRPVNLSQIEAQYMGLIKVSASMASRVVAAYQSLDPAGTYDGKDLANMYMTSFLQYLIDEGNSLKAVKVTSGWLEIDTTEDLAHYERMLAAAELDEFIDLQRTDTYDHSA